MEHSILISFLAAALFVGGGCDKSEGGKDDISIYKGMVINEIAAHDQTTDAQSWVEILNTGTESVDVSGLGLFLTDQYFTGKCLWTAPSGTVLESGGRLVLSTEDETLVTGIASNSEFELRLARNATGKAVDDFVRSMAFSTPDAQTARGSYQRIPDGDGQWRNLTYSSKATENVIFDLEQTRHIAFWAWKAHLPSLMADDCLMMKTLKAKGYDHIILNYAAFHPSSRKTTTEFIEEAERIGITVHAWIQCFHNSSGWINPIDDENNRYKDEIFEEITRNAKDYIEDYGVKGIHLDYIRFGGTAYKHNPSAEVNAVGAVTRCCRELRELCDSYNEGLVTSAALMPDDNDSHYYYGQDQNEMGKYIHILMPMIYRYSYGYNDAACVRAANKFADNTAGAQCWAGTTTYKGDDSKVYPMDEDGIMKDCEVYKDSRASGIVLFRYGLGTFPDMTRFNME